MPIQFPAVPDPSAAIEANTRDRLAILSQPQILPRVLPQIGGMVGQGLGQGVGAFMQARQQQAQQAKVRDAISQASQYLSLPEDQKNDPAAKQQGYNAMLTLGIMPPELRNKSLDEIYAEALAKAKGTAQGKPLAPDSGIEGLAQAMVSGQLAPKQLPGFGKTRAAVMNRVKEIKPGFDFKSADANFDKQTATSRYEGGSAVQGPVRMAQAVRKNMLDIKTLANSMALPDFRPGAKVLFQGQYILGSQAAAKLKTAAAETSSMIATVLQNNGVPHEQALKEAKDIFDPGQSPGQMAASADEAFTLLQNRIDALQGKMGTTAAAPAVDPKDPLGLFSK